MKKTRLTAASLALLGGVAVGVGCFAHAGPSVKVGTTEGRPPERVLVTVNGDPITLGDVDEYMKLAFGPALAKLPPGELDEMRTRAQPDILERLITDALVRQAVTAQELAVSAEEWNEAISELEGMLPGGMTLDGHLAQIGMSRQDLEAALREDLLTTKLFESWFDGLQVPTEDAVGAFYDENPAQFQLPEQVSARHILIAFGPEDDEGARSAKRERAENVRAQLADGADFAVLAEETSDCPSKSRGGELGFFEQGQMVPLFEEAAFALEPGELSEVVETRFGFHVIQCVEHEPAGTVPFAEARDEILDMLASEQKDELIRQTLTGLRDAAEIRFAEDTSGEEASIESNDD